MMSMWKDALHETDNHLSGGKKDSEEKGLRRSFQFTSVTATSLKENWA